MLFLYTAAQHYLQIPATSRSSDRLITSKRTIFEEKRDLLPPSYVKEYIYLYENYKFLKQ